jgi:hypothetical protein
MSDFSVYKAGDPVVITGTVKNSNNYPVVGLDVKARLSKKLLLSASTDVILGEFNVAEKITIPAGGEYKISYTYVPSPNTPSGSYRISFYAVEQDRFNLSGFSFANDTTASYITFEIDGKQTDLAYLNTDQILVGDKKYNTSDSDYWYGTEKVSPIIIPLYNPQNVAKKMRVTYNLFSWDSSNPANKIGTRSEEVTVSAKSKVDLKYVIEKPTIPVYYLSVSAVPAIQAKNTGFSKEETISNVRLLIEGKSKARLDFVGVDSYPLKKGREATLVTCFSNAGNQIDENVTKVETVIYDQNQKELSRTEYEDKLSPEIVGLVNKFIPKKDVSEFTVVSSMFDIEGNVIDKVEKKYNCKDIDSGVCAPDEKPISATWATIIISIIIAGLGAVAYKKRKLNTLKA